MNVRLPVSVQSLLIQCLATVLTGLLAWLLPLTLPLWQLVCMQAVMAGILSTIWRQPAWWPPLHIVFLPFVVLAVQMSIPAGYFLALFLLLLVFNWGALRTRVPFYLSDRKAWNALLPLMPDTPRFRFIDLGSGLGGVAFYLEQHFPQARLHGTEIAPAPWFISRLRAWWKNSQVMFVRRNYSTLDLAAYDVVFAFLSPAAMPDLWLQAERQMQPGSLFVSLSFGVDARPPDSVTPLANGERHTLYAWRMTGRG